MTGIFFFWSFVTDSLMKLREKGRRKNPSLFRCLEKTGKISQKRTERKRGAKFDARRAEEKPMPKHRLSPR